MWIVPAPIKYFPAFFPACVRSSVPQTFFFLPVYFPGISPFLYMVILSDFSGITWIHVVAPNQVGGASFSLDKTAYAFGEDMTVTVTGITAEMESAGACIAMSRHGAEHKQYTERQYPQAGSSMLTFTAPYRGDINIYEDFELRLYSDSDYSDETFIMKAPFTAVEPGSTEVERAKIAIVQPNIENPDAYVVVRVRGVTEEMISDGAFIAFYKDGALYGPDGREYFYVDRPELTWFADKPSEKGSYEVRLYSRKGDESDAALVVAVPFTVGD
jgi:hypothetical protein